MLELIGARGGGDVNRVLNMLLELGENQRAVVEGAGKAETIFDESGLASMISVVHATDLRESHVAFVDEEKKILGEKVNQGRRRLAGATAIEVTRIILDTLDEAGFAEHFEVVFRALGEALRFKEFVVLLEVFEAFFILGLDASNSAFELVLRSGVVGVWEDMDAVRFFAGFGGQRVNNTDVLESIEPELKAIAPFPASWEEVDGVAHDTEIAALESEVIAMILHSDEIDDEILLAEGFGALS